MNLELFSSFMAHEKSRWDIKANKKPFTLCKWSTRIWTLKFGIEIVLNEDAEFFLEEFRCFLKISCSGAWYISHMHTCMHAHCTTPTVQGRACSCTYVGSRKCFLLLLSSSFNAMGRECTARQLACFEKDRSRCATAGHVSGMGRSRSGDVEILQLKVFCSLSLWYCNEGGVRLSLLQTYIPKFLL